MYYVLVNSLLFAKFVSGEDIKPDFKEKIRFLYK